MVISIIAFILILSVLILIHEAGHFLAARKFGIWVEEFGLGLPPRAWSKQIKDTLYSINWLPLGGFVRLHGESLEEEITKREVAFLNKSKRIRTVVIVAGVTMNLLLGILIFSVIYSIYGIPKEQGFVELVYIAPNSPGEKVGLKEKDIVQKVDGEPVLTSEEFIKVINDKKGNEVELSIQRDSQDLQIKVTPRASPPEGEGPLGVAPFSLKTYYAPIWQKPFVGALYGLNRAVYWGQTVLLGIKTVFTQLFSGQIPKDLAGPLGIADITVNKVAPLGILALIEFAGILSVNLGIVNILPIPALDGGRLLFIAIEAVTKKRVSPQLEAKIHGIGMAALLTMLLGVTILDLRRFAADGRLPGFLMQIFK